MNKPKEPENKILGLQKEEGVVQTEMRKMLDIALDYHEWLQSRLPMNLPRKRAIERMRKHVKEKLNSTEVSKLKAETSMDEIKRSTETSSGGQMSRAHQNNL